MTRGPLSGGHYDITALSDERAAKLILSKQLDVLIDLNGWLSTGSMGILAFHPAPVIANLCGWVSTTGASYVDYLITDRVATPAELNHIYSERLVFTPDSYFANFLDVMHPQQWEQATSTIKHFANKSPFVLANLNHGYKLDPHLVSCWINILRRAPNAVLVMWVSPAARQSILSSGIVPHEFAPRIQWLPPGDSSDPLLAIKTMSMSEKQIDLVLDNRVYSGHTVSNEVLWSGVPIVTLPREVQAQHSTQNLHALTLSPTLTPKSNPS